MWRKFISLAKIWDQKGKKKKDQALKKYKKVVKKAEFEDSGFHVPTGSDIARNHILTKSIKAKLERMNFEREKNVESIYIDAREALALDKSFGMEIVDNEEDVVEEMVLVCIWLLRRMDEYFCKMGGNEAFRGVRRARNQVSGERKGVITLFVSNIPLKLHWSGLRQAFGRHGDLVDSYIAGKLDKQGRRFGFVRFSNEKDALRAVERLNGFKLYGFRLIVQMAKYKARTTYWRKKRNDKNTILKNLTDRKVKSITEHNGEENSSQEVKNVEKTGVEKARRHHHRMIQGHVDNETLWELSRSLIGTMATDCSTEIINDRLHAWGLGDTIVKSMGGKKFLLRKKDEELLELLEKHKWSLLEEVFANIEYWSESSQIVERTVWVEVRGITLHCWNYETFKRIAGVWGTLTALEVINLEVGNFSHNVWVSEILPIHIKHVVQTQFHPSVQAGREAESSSSSSSGSSNQRRKSNSQSNQGGDISLIEHGMKSALENKEETLEKKSNSSKSSEEENCFNENNDFTNTLVEVSKSASPISIRPSWVNVVKKSLRVDNIEQTGDMGGAGLDPIAERVTTELEGNSIMDSDMQVRRNALLEEAKKKLSQLGKWWELRLLETRLKL
ncbi:hypothetical protein V6N13_047389 [Hibiscus sabdariffa]